jgi:hypothetical protein
VIEEQDQSRLFEEDMMRSELIFGALTHVQGRFLLAKLAAKATRKLHRPNTRIQETTNDVLVRFSRRNPIPITRYASQTATIPLRRAS